MRRILGAFIALCLIPAPATAAPFLEEAWSDDAIVFETGEFDGQHNLDLVVGFTTSGRFELRDAVNGGLLYEFPTTYGAIDYTSFAGNLDGDPSDELVIYSSPGDPFFGRLGYFDVPAAASIESVNAPQFGLGWEITNYGPVSDIRTADLEGTGTPFLVVNRGLDFRVHEVATGTVKYDWAADGPPGRYVEDLQVVDLDLDGREELLVTSFPASPGPKQTHVIRSALPLGVGDPATFETRLGAAQNAPNPFVGPTRIAFTLPTRERVTVEVFDPAGRRVRTLLDETRAPGPHRVTWDGRDDTGRDVRSGMFFYEVRAGGERIARKMLRVR